MGILGMIREFRVLIFNWFESRGGACKRASLSQGPGRCQSLVYKKPQIKYVCHNFSCFMISHFFHIIFPFLLLFHQHQETSSQSYHVAYLTMSNTNTLTITCLCYSARRDMLDPQTSLDSIFFPIPSFTAKTAWIHEYPDTAGLLNPVC